MEEWEREYKRKVLDFVKAPQGVDLYSVRIEPEWDRGYYYSEYTAENPYFEMRVTWLSPKTGYDTFVKLDGDECVEFLRSLG